MNDSENTMQAAHNAGSEENAAIASDGHGSEGVGRAAAVEDRAADAGAVEKEARAAERQARKLARQQAKADRPKIRKWRGLLAGEDKRLRIMTFVCIVITLASLTFTQLGFLGVGLPGNYAGYCVTLLVPVAIAALLFGMPLGTLAGLIAGVTLFVHSLLQPLDYYEINFITPVSSIVLFTVMGFLFSFLLALALRNNPTRARRIAYVIIVSVVASLLFSLAFMFHSSVKLTFQYIIVAVEHHVDLSSSELLSNVVSAVAQLGDLALQVRVDAVLVAIACIVVCEVVERARANRGNRGIRAIFREWLFVVVTLVFMVTAAVGFIVITEQAKNQAAESMKSEIDYLIIQLKAHDERVAKLNDFLQRDAVSTQGLDEAEAEDLRTLASTDKLLDGYTEEADGTIVIFQDEKVLLSDDSDFKVGDSWQDCFGMDSFILEEALGSGKMQQVMYDEDPKDHAPLLGEDAVSGETSEDLMKMLDRGITTQMGFLCIGSYGSYRVIVVVSSAMVFAGRTAVMAWTTLSVFILLLAVFLLASRLLTHVVIRRIDETNGVLANITKGDLEARVDIRDSREFRSLSSGINTTVGALKEWISEAETRMDQELATAKAIQESALPRTFPPYPDIRRFDIYASMHPAREVGGDFYDFFLIGDDAGDGEGKLGFVVADVSGKGVPAALFMMAAKTEVRNYLESGMEPGEAVENANRKLCGGNDAGMFVTLFAGVLDYANGHVLYVNAGHNPPLLWQNGAWHWLREVSGLPLGLFDGFPYDTFQVDLEIGDEFYLYTDGVTEAMNVNGELYGEERLEALLMRNFTSHPRELVDAVRRELMSYARGAEQSDDITMLALEYGVPPELTATLVVAADIDELPRVNEFIHTELDRRLCPGKVQKQLDIALEELFVNVARYAYPNATPQRPGRVRVSYTYSAEPSVTVEIVDEGVPYNPLEKPDAVTPDDIMEVPIGGLGILMAKNSVDEMTYEYRDGSNVVAFKKKW